MQRQDLQHYQRQQDSRRQWSCSGSGICSYFAHIWNRISKRIEGLGASHAMHWSTSMSTAFTSLLKNQCCLYRISSSQTKRQQIHLRLLPIFWFVCRNLPKHCRPFIFVVGASWLSSPRFVVSLFSQLEAYLKCEVLFSALEVFSGPQYILYEFSSAV
jgi:hypothetical protein